MSANRTPNATLTFQNLDGYRIAIEFLAIANEITKAIPRGNANLVDQLKRAAMSIPLNIGEASGRTGPADAARCFAIARGSAMECAAVLDVMRVLGWVGEAHHAKGCELLAREVAMLTKLCR